MRIVFGLIAFLILLPFVIAPILLRWASAIVGVYSELSIVFYFLVYIGVVVAWIYVFFAIAQVTTYYQQGKKAQVSEISVFGKVSTKIFFQCIGIVSLIGIGYIGILYLFLDGNFDMNSMTDEEILKTLSKVILCTIIAIACVIRLVFAFFILLDTRNFGTMTFGASLQKSLELTKGKYIPVFLSFLVVFGVFVVVNRSVNIFLDGNILLLLWKLFSLICINGISFIILTSIYNTLLQSNGLIPLSHQDDIPAGDPVVEEKETQKFAP